MKSLPLCDLRMTEYIIIVIIVIIPTLRLCPILLLSALSTQFNVSFVPDSQRYAGWGPGCDYLSLGLLSLIASLICDWSGRITWPEYCPLIGCLRSQMSRPPVSMTFGTGGWISANYRRGIDLIEGFPEGSVGMLSLVLRPCIMGGELNKNGNLC